MGSSAFLEAGSSAHAATVVKTEARTIAKRDSAKSDRQIDVAHPVGMAFIPAPYIGVSFEIAQSIWSDNFKVSEAENSDFRGNLLLSVNKRTETVMAAYEVWAPNDPFEWTQCILETEDREEAKAKAQALLDAGRFRFIATDHNGKTILSNDPERRRRLSDLSNEPSCLL